MREAALEAVKVDENVAMWTNLCRTTVQIFPDKFDNFSEISHNLVLWLEFLMSFFA